MKAHNALSDPAAHDTKELYALIEALFFAYRDFTSDPDRILDEIGFGRAHHRVLHFVNRYPGMRVADLLEILQITKQSLARVLRELISKGYIEQRAAQDDKRARLLYVTSGGRALARRLVTPQLRRLRKALHGLDAEGRRAVIRFLAAMAPGNVVSEVNGRSPRRGQKTEADSA
ncbi:MAG: MarR family transcriptional regulator [Alphaproteobacteria bacterium]